MWIDKSKVDNFFDASYTLIILQEKLDLVMFEEKINWNFIKHDQGLISTFQ